ncbi:hypothetical protein PK34_13780 [Stutzerimonas stutzeri]|uniref:hypothetical protein n=1 Tax=Stutzerimonas kunmingensis TaxID=1211807 RepID=UPI00062808BD|nr:hypothetical protein [Stutzerimonas kunmingensis]KKJ95571.1 hypothetical protein PK34_13780 [Stutzerimonas stutzeri]
MVSLLDDFQTGDKGHSQVLGGGLPGGQRSSKLGGTAVLSSCAVKGLLYSAYQHQVARGQKVGAFLQASRGRRHLLAALKIGHEISP